MNELVAVLVAIAGAITFGASDVIEQRATHRVAKRPPLDLRLFADPAVNRLWLIGITVDIAGSAMQAIAVHFGPLALVQPILVLDLLFAVVITAVLARRRPDRVMGAGVLCCTGGLVLAVAALRVHRRRAARFPAQPGPAAIAAEVAGLIVMSAGVLALAYRSPHLAAHSPASPLTSQRRGGAERR